MATTWFDEDGAPELSRRASGARIQWGSILGGTVAALGVWLLLYVAGAALGLTQIESGEPGSVRGLGVFAGVWGLVAPLLALFLGGALASRSAGVTDALGGAAHGLIVWAVATLAGAWVVMNLITGVIGGAAGVTKAALGGAGTAVAGAASGGQLSNVAQSLGLDASDALAPVNDRLRSEGKPAITASQLETATKDVLQTAVREGRLDRELLISSVAQHTALSRQDSEEVAARIESQLGDAGAALQRAGQKARDAALTAANTAGTAMWGVFGALTIGLLASVGGGLVGGSKWRKAARTRRPVSTASVVRREVHP